MSDTVNLEKTTSTADEGFARNDGNPCVKILRNIKLVEEHLRKNRNRIDKIRIRHEELVDEIRELNKSLQSECADFVPKLNTLMNDLVADSTIVKLNPGK